MQRKVANIDPMIESRSSNTGMASAMMNASTHSAPTHELSRVRIDDFFFKKKGGGGG